MFVGNGEAELCGPDSAGREASWNSRGRGIPLRRNCGFRAQWKWKQSTVSTMASEGWTVPTYLDSIKF